MNINKQLKKKLLINKRIINEYNNNILNILQKIDSNASLVSLSEAKLSNKLVKDLRFLSLDLKYYHYIELKNNNFLLPSMFDINSTIILHIDIDMWVYNCTLKSALISFESFISKNITCNICIYDNSLNWCIVFSSYYFYPINLKKEKPVIIEIPNLKLN
ncbi:MAG: hypothetical protein U0354_00235 [Candidatus Sericytochromatia bacterium]